MAFRLGQGGGALCFDDVHHRLCLGQVQPAIQEGPLREFTAAGEDGPIFQGQLQGLPEGLHGPVNLDFHHVFSGVGMGGLHVDRQPLIYFPA